MMTSDGIGEFLPAFLYNHTTMPPFTYENDTFADGDPFSSSVGNETVAAAASGYCGTSLKSFEKNYKYVHGYTSLMVCLFGAQANILNLIVLTRREMINPTNAILTGLALADLLNMLEYIPYAFYMILSGSKNTYAWALFVLIHSNFSQVCHTISIWLTVTLAVWRYIMVAMHVKCKTLCSMERAKWAIASAYVTSPLLCIPIYLSFSITPLILTSSTSGNSTNSFGNTTSSGGSTDLIGSNLTSTSSIVNSTLSVDEGTSRGVTSDKYIVNLSELAGENPYLMTVIFWLYSVVIKIIPCILLTVVSLRLINSLMEAKKRKDMLLKKRTTAPAVVGNHTGPGGGGGAGSNNDHESGGSDRTTRMLLAVLLLFLITEFPQGLLGLLSGVLGDAFFKSCYIPLADLMDFVALLNSAINFILYCAMSKKFRDTFSQLFRLNRLMKLGRGRQHSGRRVHSTSNKTVVSLLNNHSHDHSTVVMSAASQQLLSDPKNDHHDVENSTL